MSRSGASPAGIAGVVVPPPLLFLASLSVGLGIDYLRGRGSTGIAFVPRFARAELLITAGVMVIVAALLLFRAAGTPPAPTRPMTAFVPSGIYRWTRNPMYLGMAAITLGIAIAADSPAAVAMMVPLLVVIRYGVIAREERAMLARFGEDFSHYRRTVRRWF